MNESTFETHLAAALERVFPTILSTHVETQTVFTLKLGHGVFKVDGPAAYAKGRSDVIVRIAGRPAVLLELKRPGLELTEDDVSQGIGYARVHEPMIPIVVVTNGADVKIYSSFDRAVIGGQTLDENRIAAVLGTAAKQAALTREEAIRSLLEGSPTAWAEALRARTQEALSELQGSMEDLTKPLCADFRFPRTATAVLAAGFAVGERSLALVGSPLSGKTNVLAELCDRSQEFEIAPLYIDCADSQDLLTEIALVLRDSFGAAIQLDRVFDWLRIGVGDIREKRPRLVLILDSLVPDESDALRKQAVSLLRNVGPNVAILFSLTDTGFEWVRNNPGRLTSSKLGRDTKIVQLRELNEDEINLASTNLYHETRILLPPGARFELPMHQPRTIRLMIAMDEHLRDIPEGHHARLPSIVSSEVLARLWETTATNTELRSDLLSLAHAYVNDQEERAKDAKLTLISMGVGTMTMKTVEKTLGGASFERLLRHGYIKRFPAPEGMLVIPTVPELLSAALISVLKPLVVGAAQSEGPKAATDLLLQYTRGLALGDRVAAILLQALIPEEHDFFLAVFETLMDDEPTEKTMESGNFLIQLPDGNTADVQYVDKSLIVTVAPGKEAVFPFGDDEGPMKLTGNLHPWNILSHLAYVPIAVERKDDMTLLGPVIMSRVGRFRSTLKDFGSAHIGTQSSIYEHDLPGFGRVPCPARGIVEPIVFAMQLAIQRFGDVMDPFVDEAITEGDPALLMRLYVAASSLEEISDPEIRIRATRMTEQLSASLDEVFQKIHAPDQGESEDPQVGS